MNPAFSRRSLMTAIGAGLVALAAFGQMVTPAAAIDKITVGALRLASHAPSFIAYERSYFLIEGLEVEFKYFQAAQPMAVAIASGDVDFGITAISGGLINLAEKGAIKVIGGALIEEDGVAGQKILVSKKAYDEGVTAPSFLKGRSFAITQTGSSFHYMAHKIAEKEGFAAAEIKLVPLQKVGAVIGALKSGQVDAWAIVPNIAQALTADGEVMEIGAIADYIPRYQVTTVFTSTNNAAEKKDLVKRFLAAFSRGAADFNAALVDKTAGEAEAEAIVQLIHKYVNPDQPYEKVAPAIKSGAMRINPNASLNLESVKDQLAWFQREGMVPATITIDMLVDPGFVEVY